MKKILTIIFILTTLNIYAQNVRPGNGSSDRGNPDPPKTDLKD